MKPLIFTICLLVNLNVFAQKVKIQEDPIISNMMSKFAEFNKQKKTTTGWRIQIASTTDRRQMDETVKNFERNFPDVPLTWIHAKPYYQVRVGAYKNKIESLRLLNTVKVDYPTAYPVQDNTIKEADLAGVKN
jgi:SPOR domain